MNFAGLSPFPGTSSSRILSLRFVTGVRAFFGFAVVLRAAAGAFLGLLAAGGVLESMASESSSEAKALFDSVGFLAAIFLVGALVFGFGGALVTAFFFWKNSY